MYFSIRNIIQKMSLVKSKSITLKAPLDQWTSVHKRQSFHDSISEPLMI